MAISLGLIVSTSSCSWFGGERNPRAVSNSDDYDDYDDDSDDEEENPFPHPKRPTAWHTKIIVSTNTQPSADEVADCIESTTVLGAESGNGQSLQQAQYQLASSIEQQPETHHWCFFQMMSALDEDMVKGGPLLSDVADKFFSGMKRLWILAQAMDTYHGHTRYFRFLRARYVAISQETFGRSIVVVGDSLGDLPENQNIFGKPAGIAPVDSSSARPIDAPLGVQATQTYSP